VRIVLPERGSVLNPVPPAPVSCGHMEGASKAARAMSEAIAKALSLSPDPEVAKRCFCLGVCSWPGNAWVGQSQFGMYTAFAWMPWRTDGLTGTLENAMSCVPTRGLMGGYPGATNFFKTVRGTGIDKVLNDGGRLPQSPEGMGGNEETLLNHITGVPLRPHEVFHQITGGGAGMGDPLLREPERVAADIGAGYVRPEVAERIYGVVLDAA